MGAFLLYLPTPVLVLVLYVPHIIVNTHTFEKKKKKKKKKNMVVRVVKSIDKVECLLTSAIWSYGHEAEVYIFLNLPFPSNPKENSSIRCILSTPEQNLL